MRPATPVLLIAAACGLPASVHAQATFTGLGMLQGAESCYARFLSADGQTASGYCFVDQATNHAFRWKSGSLQDLGVPIGSLSSEGGPLNADGSIMAVILGLGQRPGRWTESTGAMVDLGFPLNTNHLPQTISADGSTMWGFGGSHPITPRVFRWTAATSLQYLPLPPGYTASGGGHASADGSIVVGDVLSGGMARPARWVNGVPAPLTLPPGYFQGNAAAVSADGLVITGSVGDGTTNSLMRWTQAAGMQVVGVNARGQAVSADGSVIVGAFDAGGFWAAAMWTPATGLVNKSWPIDRDYLAPPAQGTLATLDPALLVTPPAGMEAGYVPIVTGQQGAGR